MDGVGTKDHESVCRRSTASPWRSRIRLGIVATVILFVLATGWFVYQHLQAEMMVSDAPVVCREAVWDFGDLSQEKPEHLHHRFKLENLSEERVLIGKVEPDCGCVVADKPPREIAPASEVELVIDVNAAGPPGPFQKLVHVILATTPVSRVTLTIRGMILPSPALHTIPEKINFGTLNEDEIRTRSAKIARYDGSPIRFQRVKCTLAALRIKGVARGDEDSFIELTMALDSTALQTGYFRSSVIVVTEHPGYSEVEVPIVAKIAASQHGLVSSVFVDRLSREASQDKPLVMGDQAPPRVEKIDYEGEGPITVKLILAGERGSDNLKPIVRVSRRDEVTKHRICRGTLVVHLAGMKKMVRIPLTVYLSE